MADFTPTLTEAQAMDIVYRGVTRESKQDLQRTLAYCKDAVALRGFNVRKLSQRLEARAEDKGESFNSDSYQSNISNANGVMGLFDYDLEVFEAWLTTQNVKSLQAIFKAFRQLFVDPKPAKPKADKPEGSEGEPKTETPQVEVVIAALAFLTPEERQLVVDACLVLGVDTAEQVETPVAA